MKFIPLLFNTEMVRALLQNRKTVTRRTRGLEEINKSPDDFSFHMYSKVGKGYYFKNLKLEKEEDFLFVKCPFGNVGDVIWVKETSCFVLLDHAYDLLEESKDSYRYVYKTDLYPEWMDYAKQKYGYKWQPSIFMPKDACRLFLEVTDIRVERLKDINEEDAILEGVRQIFVPLFNEWRYIDYAGVTDNWRSAISSFQSLWASINGFDSWDANPWVWVIRFKKVDKPEGFSKK